MNVARLAVFPLSFIVRAVGLMLLYSLTRTLFFLFNQQSFHSFSVWDIISAFGMGIRFDGWVVAATLLPLFLLEVWRWKSRSRVALRFASVYSVFAFLLHCAFIFCELSDTQYFRFTGRRTTLAVLSLSTDTFEQSVQLLRNFWVVPLFSVILISLMGLLWRKSRDRSSEIQNPIGIGRLVTVVLAGLVIGVLGLRGGLQTKPINTAHAMLLGHPQLAALALSTSFQMTHSAENRQLPVIQYFADDAEARRILDVPRHRHAPVSLENYNVVVLVVESLGLEYMGYKGINKNYAPFIKSLSEKSLYFDNVYANGRTSIDAFPSMLASLPAMVGDPFITSQYSSVRTLSLGHELAKRGYSNEFFHGCNNGSMFIDSIAKLFGFPKFYGRYDYPKGDKDYDGSWGIFDEPFLQFAAERINLIKQPFAVGIFTLSSHNPYKIPEHLKDKLPNGKLPFHKSLAYADYAVEKFFETASRQPWFNKTLFVITGDHTSDLESPQFTTEQGHYRVPLIFYDPSGQLKPAVNHRLVQHADVFPTLLDLLGIDASQFAEPLLPLGQSAFLPDKYARAANRSGDWFWYQEGRTVVRMPADGSSLSSDQSVNVAHASEFGKTEIVELKEDTLSPEKGRIPTNDEFSGIVQRARAYLQFYNNRLSHNTLLDP